MKGKNILLVDADGDCESILRAAANGLDSNLMLTTSSRDAFAVISHGMCNLDSIVVDLDPGTHGLALLEAISACADRPPIIAITALEETYMKPIAAEHGAAACLAKPIATQNLRCALTRVSQRCLTWDRWGELLPGKTGARPHFRGIAAKLGACA